ncbi:MAG TPA: DUF5668 domain-containing protein [Vicinamibacteria bacterium]|jgi:Domain of unknown function (DUF5668)|nr:DUF5668 domain-containing protein [Vicinamibacteria bacterium]
MKRSPSAAVFLSLLPGLGHIYVGQAAKGLLILLSAFLTIRMVDESNGLFGMFIPFVWLYAMIDAHRSAVEVNRIVAAGGIPPRGPDFGLTKWWGYILIGLGVLFTLDNFDLIEFEWIVRLWPLGLIALGIFILRRPQSVAPAMPTYPEPPPVDVPAQADTPSEEHGNV